MLKYNPNVSTADLAPFFLNRRKQKFHFNNARGQKWDYRAPEHMEKFADRVFASVEQKGVINPIICTTELIDSAIQVCVRHGATRLWAARVCGLTVPVLCWDHLDVLDWPEISERKAFELFTGEHYVRDHGEYKIWVARNNEALA